MEPRNTMSLEAELTTLKEANAELVKALEVLTSKSILDPQWIMNFARQAIDAAITKGTV